MHSGLWGDVMFYSFNITNFGKHLILLRKSNNLTQQDVVDRTGINIDTIRRIERGYNVPKQETLLILSYCYKHDLLKLFLDYRTNSQVMEIYNKLDDILVSTNENDIIDFCNSSREKICSKTYDLLYPDELTQLDLLLEGILLLFKEKDIKKSNDKLIEAIRITSPNYTLNSSGNKKYTHLEARIIYLLGANLLDLDECETSIKLLNTLQYLVYSEAILSKMLSQKLYALISYNYFLLDMFWNSLLYAEKGITIANHNNSTYFLHSLLSRKSIALLKLNLNGYIESMELCIAVLKIQNNAELIKHYRTVAKNKYNIIV